MVLEDKLLEYGVFGLWTAFNIGLIWFLMRKDDKREEREITRNERLISVVENNSSLIQQIKEVIILCPQRPKK